MSTTSPPTYKTFVLALFFLVATWTAYIAFSADQLRSGAWGCEMSWMMPSYHAVEWPDAPSTKYRLYLYREQGVDDQDPSGHPVIFVPGNAGSYKQVRSIASSAARQHRDGVGARPLDFFTLDLGEDFSALHAATLERQAVFLAAAVRRVRAMYPADQPVTLLGHSMGGIVARLAIKALEPGTVDAVVTMSTPHAVPPVTLEWGMERVYASIGAPPSARDPLLVSICGGVSDTQVVSDHCALPAALADEHALAVFTTGVPGAWTGVEHQAMVWCHQIRWRVARALLDMAGAARAEQLAAARAWLEPGMMPFARLYTEDVPITHQSMAVTFALDGLTEETLAHPPIDIELCDETCTTIDARVVAFPRPRAENPFPLPGEGARLDEVGFVVNADVEAVWGVLRLSSSLPMLGVTAGERQVHRVTGDSWGEHLAAGRASSPTTGPASSALQVDLTLPRKVSSLDVWRLTTQQDFCSGPLPIIHHCSVPAPGIAASESRFFPAPHAHLHSHVGGSPFLPSAPARVLDVRIYQSPDCPVTHAALAYDWPAALAKAVLRFRMGAVAWPLGWAAWVVANQMDRFKSGHAPSFASTLEHSLGPAMAKPAIALAGASLLHLLPISGRRTLVLGTTSLSHVHWTLALGAWSLGAVCFLSTLAQAMGKLRRPAKETPLPLAWRVGLPAGLLVVIYLFLPHQMGVAILFLVQALFVMSDTKPSLGPTTLVVLFFLLPFHLPGIAVWGRDVGRGAAVRDRAVWSVVPALAAVVAGSQGEATPKRAPLVRAAALALAAAAFGLGVRWTFALQPLLHVLLVVLAALHV
ncbi:GPI inositol deacylase [Cryptotrichosporon argae]